MKIVLQLLSLNILFCVSLAQLPEFNVTHTDMNETMRELVVGQTLILLSNGTDIKVTANKLVSILDAKYGNGWFSLVGTNTAINGLKTEKNTTLQFQYKNSSVTISQQQQQGQKCDNSTVKDLSEVIQQARISTVKEVEVSNRTIFNELVTKAKNVLSTHSQDCVNTTTIEKQKYCFRILSLNLYQQVNTGQHKIVADIGLNGQYYSYGTADSYIFILGDIYFDIRII